MRGVEEVYLDGHRLSSLDGVTWGELEWSERFDGGCWEASWGMTAPRGWSHPLIRAGVLVEVRVGPVPVWGGLLGEPDTASWEMTALGLSRAGEGFAALAADGTVGRYVSATTDEAIARGLPWVSSAISPALPAHANPVTTADSDDLLTISGLWDAATTAAGRHWGVDPDRRPYALPRPTTPTWRTSPGSVVLGTADEEFATHLVGRYRTTTGSLANVTRGINRGRLHIERLVDLTRRGWMSETQASDILDGMLDKIGPRAGYANGFEVSGTELTTMGGTPAPLPWVRRGQMIRLQGVTDPATGQLHHDIVIGEIRHRQGEDTVYIEPLGLAARNLTAVLEGAAA